MYNREATEYDTDFAKKYAEDLTTTLIFVCHSSSFCSRSSSHLFS